MKSTNQQNPSADSRAGRDLSFAPHYPAQLPISDKREEIVRAIREHQVLVITGETGSGKSTQIPKMCLEAGRGQRRKIGCTQPRRIAAVTLANRVAEELGSHGPLWVGYKIRFQDRTSRATRIKFMTDGILLAEAQNDRLFRGYDTLIIDEAHERTLNIDFLLGLIKQILGRRPDLKVIITSATIDPEKFAAAFGDAPIIEVSGRSYPVEVWHRPLEASSEDEGDAGYIDQAVAAVDLLKQRTGAHHRGDILIFMPTESDIRETVARLQDRRYFNTLVLPLFGRLAAVDQQRIFHITREDKIIVATNVAETSITIPGIRYVIDTGLARISQYNARSRTQGLPVVPISQASAEQRKGRCGRVAAGVCIRLYAEEDFRARPAFTPPEIQRSNLAEVILRMLYLKLGSIQDFPFIDPPAPAAVKDGFAVLQELGAVDDHRRLTRSGSAMARLPLDPRLAKILLQGAEEGALEEAMVLAAVLSIQDPRERPLDKEAQADQIHAQFREPRSDFLTLLKIWQTYQQKLAAGSSQSQLRKFCRDHFLSYRRMREWLDIHEEIREIVKDLGLRQGDFGPATYESIHRAVVSGYLSHIGLRKEKNIYLAAKNRQVMIFPGSGLFNKGGAWIVAAELVQTSRLFARTAATIQAEWLEELGKHLCRYSYSEPHWEKKRGQVVAFERVTLYGLPIVERRPVNYAAVNPGEAREIFIRSALVEGELPRRYAFFEHNQQLIATIEEMESKTRRRDLLVDDETVFNFYDARIPEPLEADAGGRRQPVVADLRTFDKLLKSRGGDHFLRMSEADLLRSERDFAALEEYPSELQIGDVCVKLRYAFNPGADEDGVTARIPVYALPSLSREPFAWLVPGMLLEKITILLKSLPKGLRRQFVPVGESAQRLLGCLEFGRGNFHEQLSRCAKGLKGVDISPGDWDESGLPQHLVMRFEVFAEDGTVLGAGRDLDELKQLTPGRSEDDFWQKAKRTHEEAGFTEWRFCRTEPKIELGRDALGMERTAYPGLAAEEGSVAVRLFKDPVEARQSSCQALRTLFELAFQAELRQLRKLWVYPEVMSLQIAFMGNRRDANQRLQAYLIEELFQIKAFPFSYGWPDQSQYRETVERLKGRLPGLSQELLAEVLQVVRERDKARAVLQRFQQMAGGESSVLRRLQILMEDLNKLVPADFPMHYTRFQVQQLPRYLKALQLRAERAYAAPEKDQAKALQLAPYQEYLEEVRAATADAGDEDTAGLAAELRWLLEEFKVSLFAPEVKTRVRVSGKRIEEKYQEWAKRRGKSNIR